MAINSCFSSFFLGVVFNGRIPKWSLAQTFVVCSWIPPEKKQKKSKTCELVPLLRVRIVQFLNWVGSSLQQTWGKRWSSWKETWKILFIFIFPFFFFGYFLSESTPEPRSGKCKIKITMKGWFSFPGSPGSREGRDFLPGFLCPSLCGEKIPLASLLCWNPKKIPSNPAQSLADQFS